MAFTYYLPDANNKKEAYTTEGNSVIIIGANGSGKSKLGAWIEEQDYSGIHRIGAQRNINFKENIALKNYTQAEELVFYGSDGTGQFKMQKGARWGWGNGLQLTTKLIDDFENVLAALIALKNNENEVYVRTCKEAEEHNQPKPNTPMTVVDKL